MLLRNWILRGRTPSSRPQPLDGEGRGLKPCRIAACSPTRWSLCLLRSSINTIRTWRSFYQASLTCIMTLAQRMPTRLLQNRRKALNYMGKATLSFAILSRAINYALNKLHRNSGRIEWGLLLLYGIIPHNRLLALTSRKHGSVEW